MHNSLEKLQVYCPRAGCYYSSLPAPVRNHPYIMSSKDWVGGWDGWVQWGEVSVSSCLVHQSCHRFGPKIVPAQIAEITKCHIIFIVFFKFEIKNAGGEDFNQFLMDIPSFWCMIFLCSWIRSYLPPKEYWWQYIATTDGPRMRCYVLPPTKNWWPFCSEQL